MKVETCLHEEPRQNGWTLQQRAQHTDLQMLACTCHALRETATEQNEDSKLVSVARSPKRDTLKIKYVQSDRAVCPEVAYGANLLE